ncbi:hypothetical protein [Parasedimentitalea denitrificans]|nr:hypothetical protein [Sedimentitalea sp. CY04]
MSQTHQRPLGMASRIGAMQQAAPMGRPARPKAAKGTLPIGQGHLQAREP